MSVKQKEFRDLLVDNKSKANVIFYGVPYDNGSSISKGSRFAPDKVRELSWWLPAYSMEGNHIEAKIFDGGDINISSGGDYEAAKNIFDDGVFKLIVCGDHSCSTPFQKEFIEYSKRKNKIPVLVHIDAHCDISYEYLGSQYSHACTVRRALENGIEEENLFMIGIREFEKDGFNLLINRANKVNLFTSISLQKGGFDKEGTLIKKLHEIINDKNKFIYISFDTDSLDASYVPGTGTPEPCGLTPFEVRTILIELARGDNVVCLDSVELSPPLDSNDISGWCITKLLYEFLAYKKFK